MSRSRENLSDHDLFPAGPDAGRASPSAAPGWRSTRREPPSGLGDWRTSSSSGCCRAPPNGATTWAPSRLGRIRCCRVAPGSRTRSSGTAPGRPAMPTSTFSSSGACRSCPILPIGHWCEPCPMTIRSAPAALPAQPRQATLRQPPADHPGGPAAAAHPGSCKDPSLTVTASSGPPTWTPCWTSSAPPGPHPHRPGRCHCATWPPGPASPPATSAGCSATISGSDRWRPSSCCAWPGRPRSWSAATSASPLSRTTAALPTRTTSRAASAASTASRPDATATPRHAFNRPSRSHKQGCSPSATTSGRQRRWMRHPGRR